MPNFNADLVAVLNWISNAGNSLVVNGSVWAADAGKILVDIGSGMMAFAKTLLGL